MSPSNTHDNCIFGAKPEPFTAPPLPICREALRTPAQTSVPSAPSDITESSVTASGLPSLPPHPILMSSPSTPSDLSLISPSAWPTDTDSSYESSILQASSPSRASFTLHQGLDTSYNTSFLRPSSVISSLDQLLTIRETLT